MNAPTSARQTLDLMLPEWQALLQGWAANGQLVAAAREALQLAATPAALSELVEQWAAGVFEALPPIVQLPASSMPGAAGAYAISTGTIYLNADWLLRASAEQAIAVLTEELGHHLDGLLNAVDTPGDEGEYFEDIISRGLNAHQFLGDLRFHSDKGFVASNGKQFPAEQSRITADDLLSLPAEASLLKLNYGSAAADYAETPGVLSLDKFNNLYLTASIAGKGIYVLKLLPNGALDVSFGKDGWLMINPQPSAAATDYRFIEKVDSGFIFAGQSDGLLSAMLIDNEGELISTSTIDRGIYESIADGYYNAEEGVLYVSGFVNIIDHGFTSWKIGEDLRLKPNQNFGLSGNSTIDLQGYDYLGAFAVNESGSLFAGGLSRFPDNDNGVRFWSLASVTRDGAPNLSFFNNGYVKKNPGGATAGAVNALAFDNDQNLLAIGVVRRSSTGELAICIQKYNRNGNLISETIPVELLTMPPSSIENATNLTMAADGGFVFAYTTSSSDGDSDIVVSKLNKEGLVDRGFYDQGVYRLELPGNQSTWGAARRAIVDDAGKITILYSDSLGGELSLLRLSSPVTRKDKLIRVRGGSLYTIVDGPSWIKAEANSVALGGHLASIASQEEQDYVYNNLNTYGFIGLTDQDVEGAWKWSDGTPYAYSNWSPGNPDNAIGPGGVSQDYAVMGSLNAPVPGQWDDQWHQQVIEGLPGIAEIPFIRRGDSAYVIVEGPTWEEAEANAVKLGGHLVTINDAAENEWLIRSFPNQPDWFVYWTGLNDAEKEGDFDWISGEVSLFANWRSTSGPNRPPYDTSVDIYDYVVLQPNNLNESIAGQWSELDNNYFVRIGSAQEVAGIAEIKLAPNNAPTGLPTLQGTFQAGATITLNRSAVVDLDNFEGYTPTFNINWEVSSNSGASWTRLTTADASDNNATYTPGCPTHVV